MGHHLTDSILISLIAWIVFAIGALSVLKFFGDEVLGFLRWGRRFLRSLKGEIL
jgi:hypothetical protein